MTDYVAGSTAATAGFDPPPILIAGDSEEALDRATRTIEAAGRRIADRVMIESAPERVERQIAAAALWIELEADRGAPLDRLLDQVNRDAGAGRYQAIVAAPSAMLDAIDARLTNGGVALVVDGDEAERSAALAVALSGGGRPDYLSDVAADHSAARLRQLSDEVSRIATTLARLSTSPAEVSRPTELPPAAGDLPDVTAVPCAPSFARAACARGISTKGCSPIRRGTCCSTCCKLRSPSCGCRCRACASPPRSPRRPRCAGSR